LLGPGAEQLGEVTLRAPVEPAERGPPLRRQPDELTAAILAGAAPRDQAVALKAVKDAAHVAGVEAQVAAELGDLALGPSGELIDDPGLGGGEGAVEVSLLEESELPRVEAVEGSDGGDATGLLHAARFRGARHIP